ncbi:hypothetical protein ABTX15_27010 [Micromonospora sp. NPDC094482]|uniref:hypothetical protein n=1 Tax=unclassified Micromonospora TaxID=2617518 RepID=UPI00333248AA
MAGEVQHSKATPRSIQVRQRALRKAGDRVVWTTDRGASDIAFLHAVPHLSVPALADHRMDLSETRLEIGAGAITFETQRCGWADLWTGTTRCPATRKAKPCCSLHLYPTLNPHSYSRQMAATTAMFPCGPRPHLDHLLEGILHGTWLRTGTATASAGSPSTRTPRSRPSEAEPSTWPRADARRAVTGPRDEHANGDTVTL